MKRIQKLLMNGALCTILAAGSSIPVAAATSFPSGAVTAVYVNGTAVDFDTAPEIVNGRTFVPMRAIFEAMGAEVTWSDARREAVAELGASEVVLKIDSNIGLHNTDAAVLDAAPYIKQERTMLPLRYLSESLGYKVEWDNSARSVSISSEKKTDSKAVAISGNAAGLTYTDAVKQYDKVNPSVQKARLTSQQAAQSVTEFNEVFQWIGTYTLAQQKKALTLAGDWTAKQVLLAQSQGAYSITNEMDKISLKMAEIQQKKSELENKKKALDIARIKLDAGAGSQADYSAAQSAVKAAEQAVKNLETELQGLYVKLYGNLEYKQENYQEPEFKLEYKPIGEVDLEKKYEADLKEDPYIWYLEHAKDNAKYNLDTYEYNMGEKSYTLTSMDLTSARINLGVTKQNLHDTVFSRYNQILQIENNIATLEDQIDAVRDGINTLRTNYQYGAASKYALESSMENLSALKYQLLMLKSQHQQLVRIFESPWLAPEYMSAG